MNNIFYYFNWLLHIICLIYDITKIKKYLIIIIFLIIKLFYEKKLDNIFLLIKV